MQIMTSTKKQVSNLYQMKMNNTENEQEKNQLINKTYTYEIYETEPAPGYKNTLEKVYIALIVKIKSL